MMEKILCLRKRLPIENDGYEVGEISLDKEMYDLLRRFGDDKLIDALSYIEQLRRVPNPYTDLVTIGFDDSEETPDACLVPALN